MAKATFRLRGSMADPKLGVAQASVTGTGTIQTGLNSIITGSAMATVSNAATATPTNVVEISGTSGGGISVIVTALASAPTITIPSAVASNVNVTAWGA